ncbi:unnamed protein product [Citrullus colocynthis]|uniref:Uncharacterized protein n=1 Tax=Citrullus colocynthis TaxID=252529 RepID=A0ABP0XNG5_9ROSI
MKDYLALNQKSLPRSHMANLDYKQNSTSLPPLALRPSSCTPKLTAATMFLHTNEESIGNDIVPQHVRYLYRQRLHMPNFPRAWTEANIGSKRVGHSCLTLSKDPHPFIQQIASTSRNSIQT